MPAYNAAYKPAGLEAGKYKESDPRPPPGGAPGGAPRGEGAPYLSFVKTPAGWIGATISHVCNSKSWNFLVFKIGIISGHPLRQNSP
jgi:hypothetical protein